MNNYPFHEENKPSNAQEYSVSELSLALKRTVEDKFGHVRIRGEISGCKRAASGHVYLNLKDEKSVIDAVMWKGVAARLTFVPEDGLEVICSGKLTTYPGRSKYQIVINNMEVAGEGALMALLEKRKKDLTAEGLFDSDRKRALPYLPKVIGVVTSPTGSVIRDILHRLSDRFARHVLVWPVLVQGEGAATQIAAAIDGFNKIKEGGDIARPDVLIIARGGGSLEDLWCFNEEEVVRAVARSEIPLISAVGHETDTTLIDYVSDFRSPTPSAAAERAVPVRDDLVYTVKDLDIRLQKTIRRFLKERSQKIDGLARGLPKPSELLSLSNQRFDDLSDRLPRALRVNVERRAIRLDGIKRMLRPEMIVADVKRGQEKTNLAAERLNRAIDNNISQKTNDYENASRLLQSLSYHNVLERGFAVIRDEQGKAFSDGKNIKKGAYLGVEFRDGVVHVMATGGKPHKKTIKKKKDVSEQGQLL